MRPLRELTWVEMKLFAREPITVLFVLVLPVVILYVLNGVFGGGPPDPTVWEGLSPVDFYTSSYVALVVATVGVLSLPVHLAAYREQGVLRRFRASALQPKTLVGAHAMVAFLTATAGAVLLVVVSYVGYDATMPRDWLGVVGAFILITLAFAAVGALLGFVLPTARAAQSLGVLLFFVFMMLGGAGPPQEVLPTTLARISDVVPVTQAGDLLRGPWLDRGWDLSAVFAMVGLLVACAGLTAWRLRSESG